jgi:molybdopterin-guanine dinucleotide biosynthesis protein MobB
MSTRTEKIRRCMCPITMPPLPSISRRPTVTVPPQVRIVSFVGKSGSGKTTLIEQLIRYFTTRGSKVAALKHTHHPLTELSRGDTARFLRAGASEVVLADDSAAIRWRPSHRQPDRFSYADRGGLIESFGDADWLFVEGFKSDPPGLTIVVGDLIEIPQNTIACVSSADSSEVVRILDRIADQ